MHSLPLFPEISSVISLTCIMYVYMSMKLELDTIFSYKQLDSIQIHAPLQLHTSVNMHGPYHAWTSTSEGACSYI